VRLLLLPVCMALGAGCGSVLSSDSGTATPATSAAELPANMRGLRVRVADEVAIVVEGSADPRLADQLKAALQAELGRLGLTVVRANDKSFDLSLRIETRVTGAVSYLRGRVGLTAEKGGVAVAQGSSVVELHRNGDFPAIMTQKAVAELLNAPALAAFAERRAPSRELPRDRPTTLATAPVATPAMAVRNPTRNPTIEAKAHAQRGTSLYNLGRFAEALAEYEAAYLAVQDPPFLFNIAQCHRKLGKNKEALDAYRTYLRVAPEAPNRSEVQKRIAELEHQVHAAR
jgi:tetratricopeptide (TPR) repeat protein